MFIKDILEFNQKKYFGGAVQSNWFYDEKKVNEIASSYVFHGPKYHGVGKSEKLNTQYKLYDTASYALALIRKAHEKSSNRFNMTIAGYGTGKSHLSVALGSLLSGYSQLLRSTVIENICKVDKDIGESIRSYSEKNLVLVLNGMRDFNLNSEVLTVAKKALLQHGISSDVFSEITKHYSMASNFVRNTFASQRQIYADAFNKFSCPQLKTAEDIIEALECANSNVFSAVNEVYKGFVGTDIPIESGISAAEVLSLLERKFCCEKKIFKSIYILFDEFGRYIEFTARSPEIAGDSALQQIFEAVQNADGNIIFDAFIQSDLNAYLSRVESSSNIVRYVGRYENSDKYYLSSNFETVLANLIQKKDAQRFESCVEHNINSVYASFHQSIFNNLNFWAKSEISERYVWTNEKMYFDVIAEGCYPLHPITVWFLANTSSWMQQRSTLSYTCELFDRIKNEEVSSRWLPYIYPTDIVGTGLFDEMQNSEERGLVSSQHCLAYQSIISQQGDKFSEKEINVLRAVLIINIMKFKFYDRISCLTAIHYCTGLKKDTVAEVVTQLENEFCVISMDENTNRFGLNAEAHGKREFQLAVIKKQQQLRNYDPICDIDEDLLNDLGLNTPIETPFASENGIASPEWCYQTRLVNISQINDSYLNSLKSYFNKAIDGETPRGVFIYVYCGNNSENKTEIAKKLISVHNMKSYPVIFSLLIDKESTWLYYLRRRAVYRLFNQVEIEMYSRFISVDLRKVNREIVNTFRTLTLERNILTDRGVEKYPSRMKELCLSKFKEIYTAAVPFSFDGFEKKSSPAARKTLLDMCLKIYSGTICNQQAYQGIEPKMKNRIQAVLSTGIPTSWQVFDGKFELCEPKNLRVKKMYQHVVERIKSEPIIGINILFKELLYAPYGLNYNSLFLFVIYVLSINSSTIQLHETNMVLTKTDFMNKYLSVEKKNLDNIMKLMISVKTQTDDEIIKSLLEDINKLTYVEYCTEYQRKLKQLCNDSDLEQKYSGQIAVAKLNLNEGLRIYKQLYDSLAKYEKQVEESAQKFSLSQIVNVLSSLKRRIVNDPIEDSCYCYSDIYCTRVENLLEKSEEILDKYFYRFINSLKCAYSQSSEFKKKYSRDVKILQNIGFSKYAKALKDRIQVVIAEAEMHQKYSKSLAEADQFITFTKSSLLKMDRDNTNSKIAEVDSWEQFFMNAVDLKDDVRNKYISLLSEVKEALEERLLKIDTQIVETIEEIKAPTLSIVALREYLSTVIQLKPTKNDLEILTDAINQIDEFQSRKKFLLRDVRTALVSELKSEYETKWVNSVCDRYMLELIKEVESNIEKMRDTWMNQQVYSVAGKLSNMSIEQCQRWRSRVSELPVYLNEDDLEVFSRLSEKVNEKLKGHKINGVVEMFKSLTDDEKRICLDILNEI